jgi:hypothetical protein
MNNKDKEYLEKKNITESYNLYFKKNGQRSIYNNRFGKERLAPREKNLVKLAFHRAFGSDSNEGKFVIIDYGCGDGRYLSAFEEIAHLLKRKNIFLEVISYDPSIIGLECYQEMLLKEGYKYLDEARLTKRKYDLDCAQIQGYYAGALKKDNLIIKFIHANPNDDIEYITKLIGGANSSDIVLCMFGTLSHIPTQKARRAILSMFKDVVKKSGYVVVNVPTAKSFEEDLITYNKLREQKSILQKRQSPYSAADYDTVLGIAQEEGDIYYCKFDVNNAVKNYYNIYNKTRLEQDLTSAGLNVEFIDISTILHPAEISHSKLKAVIDELIIIMIPTNYIPAQWMDRIANYLVSFSRKSLN